MDPTLGSGPATLRGHKLLTSRGAHGHIPSRIRLSCLPKATSSASMAPLPADCADYLCLSCVASPDGFASSRHPLQLNDRKLPSSTVEADYDPQPCRSPLPLLRVRSCARQVLRPLRSWLPPHLPVRWPKALIDLLGRLPIEALVRTELKKPREVQRHVTLHGVPTQRDPSTPEPFLLHRPDEPLHHGGRTSLARRGVTWLNSSSAAPRSERLTIELTALV